MRTPPLTSLATGQATIQTSTGSCTCNGGKLYRNVNNIRVRSFILTGAPLSISEQSDFCTQPLGLLIWQRVRISEIGGCGGVPCSGDANHENELGQNVWIPSGGGVSFGVSLSGNR
jgi:hypothetical protein